MLNYYYRNAADASPSRPFHLSRRPGDENRASPSAKHVACRRKSLRRHSPNCRFPPPSARLSFLPPFASACFFGGLTNARSGEHCGTVPTKHRGSFLSTRSFGSYVRRGWLPLRGSSAIGRRAFAWVRREAKDLHYSDASDRPHTRATTKRSRRRRWR